MCIKKGWLHNALKIPAELRWSERLVFDIIATLSPQIRDLPIEGPKWRFDRKESDAQYKFPEGCELRKSMTKRQDSPNFDWRKLDDPSIKQLVKAQIFDNYSEISSIIFNKQELENYIDNNKYPQTIWHIHTMNTITNGFWKETSRKPKTENIEIKVN